MTHYLSALHAVILCLLLATGVACHGDSRAVYVGSKNCQQCHSAEYEQWLESDHFKAMARTDEKTVLGDFSGNTVEFHGMETTLQQQNNRFLVTTIGGDGKKHSYPVAYTFGHYPLQQYLLNIGKGRLQALDIAWDSRPQNQGGQRWFHLQPTENITPKHPFFWTGHFQNWNSRCADCHSTNLQRNYSPADGGYSTTWSDINVACEACHGPGSNHVTLAKTGKLTAKITGFSATITNNSQFVFNGSDAIARNSGGVSQGQLEVCASCHSRREQIGATVAGKSFHDQFQLSLVDDGLYFADGQINDEVFEYGSFLQSKMHQAGVTCTNCHNAHSGKLKAQGNGLCLQCHQAETYQAPSHHHHKTEAAGARCVSCHMPERVYMGVDGRRDHSFSIPRPALARSSGAPDACSGCHDQWQPGEAMVKYRSLFGDELPSPWTRANIQARQMDVLALRNIANLAKDPSVPEIRRATLVQQMAHFPSRLALEILELSRAEKSPLIRAAAANGSAFLPPLQRLELLKPLITDPAKNVRMAAARNLADAFMVAPQGEIESLRTLFTEYEQSLRLTADSPSTQIRLGSYFLARGDRVAAERAYQQALKIEPAYVPALLNLADMKRSQGSDAEAEKLLKTAIGIAPDSGAAHHALGLFHIRQKQLAPALIHLKQAEAMEDATPRFAYVYAVALESAGQRESAIRALIKSDKRWPNQPESLLLLVSLLDQSGRKNDVLPYLSRLSQAAPGDIQVKRLVKKYARPE